MGEIYQSFKEKIEALAKWNGQFGSNSNLKYCFSPRSTRLVPPMAADAMCFDIRCKSCILKIVEEIKVPFSSLEEIIPLFGKRFEWILYGSYRLTIVGCHKKPPNEDFFVVVYGYPGICSYVSISAKEFAKFGTKTTDGIPLYKTSFDIEE